MKALNTKAKAMKILEVDVLLQTDGSKGILDFTVIRMDDFEVILGKYLLVGN